MKTHACQYPSCTKSFTRAEHLRRHALNHEQPRHGFTCERCSVHFQRPDLLGKKDLTDSLHEKWLTPQNDTWNGIINETQRQVGRDSVY